MHGRQVLLRVDQRISIRLVAVFIFRALPCMEVVRADAVPTLRRVGAGSWRGLRKSGRGLPQSKTLRDGEAHIGIPPGQRCPTAPYFTIDENAAFRVALENVNQFRAPLSYSGVIAHKRCRSGRFASGWIPLDGWEAGSPGSRSAGRSVLFRQGSFGGLFRGAMASLLHNSKRQADASNRIRLVP